MEKFVQAAGIPVRIAEYGGQLTHRFAAALLHGYLETMDVWSDLAEVLGGRIYTLTLDLPGHGLSGTQPSINTMEFMADAIDDICGQLGVETLLLVGHSMGGYVALSFAKKYPHRTAGLCLFHSTPNADTEEKRQLRSREIDCIAANQFDSLVKITLPKMFAPQNVQRMQCHIDEMTCVLHLMEDTQGIVACIEGMKERKDMNGFLKTFNLPLLFLFGKNDMYISEAVRQTMMQNFPQAQAIMLEHSGHCGFLEEPDKAADALIQWIERCKSDIT